MTTAKDNNGNCYRIHKDDTRLKTGELKGITKDRLKIIKNNKIKMIDPSELEKYEAEGWKRGLKTK